MERLKADLGLTVFNSANHTSHKLFAGIRSVFLVEMHCHKVNAFIVTHLPIGKTRTLEPISEHSWLHHIEGLLVLSGC